MARYYFGIMLFIIILFFFPCTFFVETPHKSGSLCLQRGKGRIHLEILFIFQILSPGWRRKFVDPGKVNLISMVGKGFHRMRNILQHSGLWRKRRVSSGPASCSCHQRGSRISEGLGSPKLKGPRTDRPRS